ncbi:MAG: glycine cleavage system aminomethyltransferase GcvT [Clostridiales bacterium]|jgi:aminomethyltransferase|nr:glycine cleavage system aminomethyltransferase GcvT [Clostridiales bacterium]
MKYTVLYDRLKRLSGKFVEFGGFYMPVQFSDGILAEHKAVRESAGIFDVSHMGEFVLEGKDVEKDIAYLFSNDFSDIPDFKVRYTLMLNERGGVVDDLLVYRAAEKKYYVVVNASNIDKDRAWIEAHIKFGSRLKDVSEDTAMIAVQGPKAESIAGEIFGVLPKGFYTFLFAKLGSVPVTISRTGYTGEDGFEIYSSNAAAGDIFDAALAAGKKYGAVLAGLGARDTLRLESAMPLYGHEMNEDTLASEIGLDRFIKMQKHDFIGKDALASKKPEYTRIGLRVVGKGIARENCAVFSGDDEIGRVTSGTMSPSLGYPIAMARVKNDARLINLSVDVRGRRLAVETTAMPFYKKTKQ